VLVVDALVMSTLAFAPLISTSTVYKLPEVKIVPYSVAEAVVPLCTINISDICLSPALVACI